MRARLLAAAVAALATPAAAATDLTTTSAGYTYFNKPGATMAQHDTEVRECKQLAGKLHQPTSSPGATFVAPAGVSPMAAGIGGAIGMAIVMAVQQKLADNKGAPVNVEHCMVAKGWRVVAVDPAEGAAIAAMQPAAKATVVAPWVGAAEPHGRVVRAFTNEAALPGAQIFAAATKGGTPLSSDVAKAAAGTSGAALSAYTPPAAGVSYGQRPASAKPPKPLKDAELGGVPDGMGLVVINVAGDAEIGVELRRMGPASGAPAWTADGRADAITVERPQRNFAKPGQGAGATFVYAVPPGRWRVSDISVNWIDLSLCLGGPAFDIAAGEAVYAGSFAPDHLAPDMTLEPAKAAFPGLSSVPDKLRAAEWINGAQGQCGGTYMYVLEVPGRPYLQGYAFGARAMPAGTAGTEVAAGSALAPAAPPALAPDGGGLPTPIDTDTMIMYMPSYPGAVTAPAPPAKPAPAKPPAKPS